LLERKAHDAEFGGYREFFNADWSAPGPDARGPLGAPGNLKLMNTHLHLLEAFTATYQASKLSLVRARLAELIGILSDKVVRREVPACTDAHERDWTPRRDERTRVSYGHDVENIWLLLAAAEAAGRPPGQFTELFVALFANALRYGYDTVGGGFYDSGKLGQPADARGKTWWVQAEALVSALAMHRLTGDAAYLDVFAQTLDFVERKFVDWAHGEWHARLTPEGQPQGDKANIWKAGYHNGRAMILARERLAELAAAAPAGA
jgi:mannobiose 2-epimerase